MIGDSLSEGEASRKQQACRWLTILIYLNIMSQLVARIYGSRKVFRHSKELASQRPGGERLGNAPALLTAQPARRHFLAHVRRQHRRDRHGN
jgi:hypothetical protein